MDLEELLECHIDRSHHSVATERTYRTALSVFQRDTSIRMVNDITTESVEWWKQLVLSRASGSTWNNYHRHMSILFDSAIKNNLIAVSNPFKQVRQITKPIEKEKICSLSSIKEAIAHIKTNPGKFHPAWFWVGIIRMFYYTGMRRRQLVGLTWADINYGEKTLLLSALHSKTKKQWNVPITAEVNAVLVTMLTESRSILGRTPDFDAQIFNVTLFNERYTGNVMKGEQVTGMFRKLRNAGFPISPHKLRHTMATQICNIEDAGEASVALRTLQVQLGHSDISTTAKYMRPSLKAQALMISQLKCV